MSIFYIPCFKTRTTASGVEGGEPQVETTRAFLVAMPSKAGGLVLLHRPTKKVGNRLVVVAHTKQDRQVLAKVGRSRIWTRSGYEVVPATGEECPEDYLRVGDFDIPVEATDKVVAQWGGESMGFSIATDGEMVSPDREGAEDALAELKELDTEQAMKELRGKGWSRRDTGESKALAEVQATLALLLQAQTVAAPVAVPEAPVAPVAPVAAPVAAKVQSVGADAMAECLALLQSLSKAVATQGEALANQGEALAKVQADLYEDSDDSENGENGES